MKRQRHASRQSPRSRRPNQRVKSTLPRALQFGRLFHFVMHPNRQAGVILVFDLSLGQRRAVMQAPINRLQPFVGVALFDERQKRVRDHRLVFRVHCEIRLIPLAKNAQPFEVAPVLVHVLRGERAAHAAKLRGGNAVLFSAQVLLHFCLDRQAVAVPSGNIRRAKPGHGLRSHHHVFADFIQPGPQVNVPGGVRRPIVKDEKRRVFAGFQYAAIDAFLFPLRQLLRLALRQLRLHRKARAGQIDGAFHVERFRHGPFFLGFFDVQQGGN